MNRNCRYINHPLNNSPSKQAYTFSKSQRFLQPTNEKIKGDQSVKFEKTSGSKQIPSSDTSFTKDSGKNKKQQPQRKYSSKERVRSVIRERITSNEQKKKIEGEKQQEASFRREEEKIKVEQVVKEDRFMKKKNSPNIPVMLKTESLKRLPPRPPGRRDFLKQEPVSTISKAKSATPRYFQSQKRNALAFTFSRSPRVAKGKIDPELGPGTYEAISQFGDCSQYSIYKR